jgi:hypothetical protein
MKTNNNVGAYPYLSVIILFAGLGSMVGGVIAELGLLFIFRLSAIAICWSAWFYSCFIDGYSCRL